MTENISYGMRIINVRNSMIASEFLLDYYVYKTNLLGKTNFYLYIYQFDFIYDNITINLKVFESKLR